MSTSKPLTQRTWSERLSLGLAGALVAVCAATLAGWWFLIDELVQPLGVHAPLEVNAALSFGLLGAALLACELIRRYAMALAVLGTAVGLATWFESLSGFDLRIDQLLAPGRVLFQTEHPGRMPAALAGALTAAGLVLLWRLIDRARPARLLAEAALGSVLAAAGLSTILGYGANLPEIYRWGTATEIAPAAAVILILLGLALVLLAGRESVRTNGNVPVWSAIPVAVMCLSLTGVLWLGLRGRDEIYVAQTTQTQLDKLIHHTEDLLDKQAVQFERLTRRWSDGTGALESTRITDAARQMTQSSGELGCVAISFLDPSHQVVWTYPVTSGSTNAIGSDAAAADRSAALQRADNGRGQPAFALNTIVSAPGGPELGFVIYAPVIQGKNDTGALAAEFSHRLFFQTVTRQRARIDDDYHVAVTIDGTSIFQTTPADASKISNLAAERTQLIAEHRVRFSVTPSHTTVARNRRLLPELALVAGVGITLLLALSVHLARRARAGQRAAELSNEKLLTENEERRRVEDRLNVSDERLRLALDSTRIGIFEWNVATGHVYYSPGLWSVLGHDPALMAATVETWQSLLHPDDVALFRRQVDAQLKGTALFAESEYRVRSGSGEWRWVNTRSKFVAAGAEGRPARIVGTVQDITARRGAEQALRESQAEARKLSLVAAKTDSPVLIASPDGLIEWANDAFCRVMEYRLEEVVGRNPVYFMDGPDTNPRTIARIRAALARGAGISTDVINYSKSGRKYHLHVEIQPVRRADGEIEHFIAVETDMTARVETELQLRRAKAEADDASRAKSEFLASMSHEIRTPMNGVIGMTSLLMDTALSEEQHDYVNTIRTSGEALLTIINDILDFSKIESGKMELERSPFELSLVIEDALDLFALQASAKRIEIGYHLAPDVPTWLVGDPTRLRQVIVNLVNNAVKFTPSGSVSVEVRNGPRPVPKPTQPPGVEPDFVPTTLEVRILDTGIGIPPERVARLFKAFSQVDSSTTRKYGGTGLGLAISQRLCQLMGGDIRVEPNEPRGTAFIFTLQLEIAPTRSDSGLSSTPETLRGRWVLCVEDHPVTQARLKSVFDAWSVDCVLVADAREALAAAAARPTPPALLVVDSDDFLDGPPPLDALAAISCPRLAMYPFGRNAPVAPPDGHPFATTTKPLRTISFILSVTGLLHSSADGGTGSQPPSEKTMAEEIPLEVLVAEDNAVNQKVALRLLERLGYRADAVANGLEAVTTLENRRYDLVLMDLQMPEMDGFEATRQIRRRLPAGRQPKIVALTANAMDDDRERCVAAGMDDHISKPVKIHEIADAIRRHFGKPAETSAPTL